MLDPLRRRLGNLKWRLGSALDRIALARQLPPMTVDGHRRSSQYVAVRDGTKIALDLYRPVRRGVVLDRPLPVIWAQERYHRARFENGRLWTRLDSEPWLKLLIRLGYVVGIADLRGSGASFGSRSGLIVEEDRWDAFDVTEWLAAQTWSNGRIGMFGKSFMGLTQYLAASTSPPHLVAIFPEKTLFDLYSFAYSGGVFRSDYALAWGENLKDLDTVRPAAPVDEDLDGSQVSRAMEEHQANCDMRMFSELPFRDSKDGLDRSPYEDQSPARHSAAISESGVAIHQLAGWYDMWPRDALLWHSNLSNPRRLLIGPWAHTQDSGWRLFMERLRWWDHWLRDIDNGVMDEAPIRYFTIGAPRGTEWRSAQAWPLPEHRPSRFYFGPGQRGAGAQEGCLTRVEPAVADGVDTFTVDYTASSGMGTRWKNGYGREFGYGNLSRNDAKGLCYTSAVLQHDVEVTGHPIVSVWITSSAPDVDVFAYLEEIRASGYSEYVTEGVLRASHRAEAEAAFDNLGLPHHESTRSSTSELPDSEPAKLLFDLHPISRVFRAGRRIRVTLTGADADNALTLPVDPPPRISVHRSSRYPSYITLPLLEQS